MNTKKVLGIAAVTLLVAVVLAGAGAAAVGDDDVAKIGETGYATLALAVAGATDGDTIVVLKDCSIDANLTIGHTITFANNGTNHVITVNDGTGLTTITIASGKTVTFGTTVSESGYSGLLFENPAYKNGSSSPLLTIEDGAGVSGLYLKASTATVQGYLDEVVLIKGSAAVADSVFDFTGIKNAEQGGYLSPQVGVAVEGTGDVTLTNCSITTGDDADHKSMPLMVSKSSGKVTITGGSLTAGDSKDDRESVCLRICGQGAGDENAIILNGVTLNAVRNGDRNVGIAVDHKTGIAADAVLDLQNVTFNVNGWELWKEDDTNPNTVKIGTLSGLGDALNLSMCAGVGKITLAGIGTTTVDSNAVAKIGDTYYAALTDAVTDANAATSNVTLTLLKDITDTGAHFTNTAATVTFDLNGHTMSYPALATWTNPAAGKPDINGVIVNEGKLVIRDSATGGKISSEAQGGATNTCVFNAPGATCTIESGTFVMGEAHPEYTGFYAILNAGTMTINGGTFVFYACGSSLVSNWNTMTVTGGSFTIDNTACTKYVFNNEKGTDYGISTTPSLTISGSDVTVTHKKSDGVALRCLDAGSTAAISNGTISGTLVNSKSGQDNGTISCTGGTYTADPAAFVAAGYHAEAQGTTPETWKVVVDTTYYTVSFDMQGHGTQVQPQSIEEGTCVTRPENPIAVGYVFGGWYKEADCITAFDFSKSIEADTVLYAKWTPGNYAISTNSVNFGTATIDAEGKYTAPDAQSVTVTNSSPYNLGIVASGESTAFDFEDDLPVTVTPGHAVTLTVQPSTALSEAGVYTDMITVTPADDVTSKQSLNVSITFTLVNAPIEEKQTVIPVAPEVKTKEDETGATTEVVVNSEKNEVIESVGGNAVAITSCSAGSNVTLVITDVTVEDTGSEKIVTLGEGAKIAAMYEPAVSEASETMTEEVQYTATVGYDKVDTNFIPLTGEYKSEVAETATRSGYEPLAMVSPMTEDVEIQDENIAGTTMNFTVSKSDLPEDTSRVKILHVESTNVTPLTTTVADDGTDPTKAIVSGTYEGGFSSYVLTVANDTPTPTHSGSSTTTFSGSSSVLDGAVHFDNAVVVTDALVPGATKAMIVNKSGNGWYNFDMTVEGFTGNGVLYFQVPLDVLQVKGFTTGDVGLYHQEGGEWVLKPTTFLKKDTKYAYYSATFDSCSPFMVDFEEGATTTAATETTPVTTTPDCKITISGASSLKVGEKFNLSAACACGKVHNFNWKVSDPSVATVTELGVLNGLKAGTVTVTVSDDDGHSATKVINVAAKETQTAAKTPFPILGILAGLGITGFVAMRRK